jgi:hypothetical protein
VYVTMGSSRIVARVLNLPAGKLDKLPASDGGWALRPPRAVDLVRRQEPPSEACTQTQPMIEPTEMAERFTVFEEACGSSSGEHSTALGVELVEVREAS